MLQFTSVKMPSLNDISCPRYAVLSTHFNFYLSKYILMTLSSFVIGKVFFTLSYNPSTFPLSFNLEVNCKNSRRNSEKRIDSYSNDISKNNKVYKNVKWQNLAIGESSLFRFSFSFKIIKYYTAVIVFCSVWKSRWRILCDSQSKVAMIFSVEYLVLAICGTGEFRCLLIWTLEWNIAPMFNHRLL